jgi:hypothetical protein
MPVTFKVDEVVPAETRAPTVPLRELVGAHAFLGVDPELSVLAERTMHPLLGAVHHAFVDHRPLVLSPDAVWLTIAQGVAQHVRLNAEELRPRLVAHAGKQTLVVTRLSPPSSATEWAEIISGFRAELARVVGEGRARLLTCDFSTTGDAERIASEVVLMDVLSSYYDYVVSIVCGIPRITLLGTVDDWQKIRARVDVIAELDLEDWARSLQHIADQLVAAAAGHPDTAFFQGIYKPRSAYGWDRVTGWIARLYPYIQSDTGDYSRKNPLLALSFDHEEPETDGYYAGDGIRSCDTPPGASRVLVRMNVGRATEYISVEGGLLAVEQTTEGELVPRAGFLVREAHEATASVVERLRNEHGAPPGKPGDGMKWQHDAALRTFFESIGPFTLRLGDAAWTFLPPVDRKDVLIARDSYRTLYASLIADLGDGSSLAVSDERHVIRLRSDRFVPLPPPGPDASPETCELQTDERLEVIPVLAPSFIGFLARTLRDGVDLRSTTSLLDVSPDWHDTPYHLTPLFDRLRREGKLVAAAPLDARPINDPFDGVEQIIVGSSTWRRFTSPTEWRQGNPGRRVTVVSHDVSVAPIADLGDGTLLARVTIYPRRDIVRITLAAITTRPLKRRMLAIESSQPADTIAVLGRSFIDVLTFALEHDQLPRLAENLAELVARARPPES